MKYPLDGITVIDLSHALAGPFCTTMLADYGAQVIKIEPPTGDIARGWGSQIAGGETAYFVSLHRNNRGVVLDLKTAEGKEVFFKLLEKADVVIENYRVGALKRMGLDYEAARKRNPGIIYCSISGFGQDGPYRDRAALDLILQAESGLISVTGEPGTSGTRAGVSIADLTAGMNAAYAIMLALRVKEKTGVPTIAVGLITEPQQAEAVLQAGDADMVALGRTFLFKPRWGWEAAAALGGEVQATSQYWRSLPREATGIFGSNAKIGMR